MALIGWAGGLLGTQVQFLQVAAGLDVAGADAGAEADAGDVQAQALGGFQIAAFETGEKETPGGALFGQGDGGSVGGFLAGATMTPGSHISREGMKPFTKPPKMMTSKVRPKRSSGGPTATAGVVGLALLPHGSAPFRVEDGLATALSSHASLWREEERDVTLAVTADAEELSAVESSAMSVSGWFSSLCSPSSRWAAR